MKNGFKNQSLLQPARLFAGWIGDPMPRILLGWNSAAASERDSIGLRFGTISCRGAKDRARAEARATPARWYTSASPAARSPGNGPRRDRRRGGACGYGRRLWRGRRRWSRPCRHAPGRSNWRRFLRLRLRVLLRRSLNVRERAKRENTQGTDSHTPNADRASIALAEQHL
jgi:hypothetical protein